MERVNPVQKVLRGGRRETTDGDRFFTSDFVEGLLARRVNRNEEPRIVNLSGMLLKVGRLREHMKWRMPAWPEKKNMATGHDLHSYRHEK